MRARRLASAVVALVMVSPLVGCGEDEQTLTVLAAASLTDVFEELAVAFEDEHDVEVTFSFGSSTALAEQAADGAPGDVLATADPVSMGIAEEAGVLAGGPHELATNQLVLVAPRGNPARIRGLEDLDRTTWVRCAESVPCGRLTSRLLTDAGVTAEPASLEEDARATLDKVVSGEAGAGFVYGTDARAAGDRLVLVALPHAEPYRTTYLAAALEQAQSAGLAREWVDLLTSEQSRSVLRDAGFTVP